MRQAITNILALLLIVAIGAVFVLNACGLKPFIIKSGSMEPAIMTGSVCFVDTKAEFDDIEVGDVIAFKVATGEAVTHRAISIVDGYVETKGDANDASDGFTTSKDNFMGQNLITIPRLGYVIGYLQNPAGKAMIGVVILAIIAFAVIDAIADRAERKKALKQETKTEA